MKNLPLENQSLSFLQKLFFSKFHSTQLPYNRQQCLTKMMMLDSSKTHTWKFFFSSNLLTWLHHLQRHEILKNDMQILTITTNGVFLQKILSWFGNWGTSRNIFVEIDLFPDIVTDFKCCHSKLHLRCDRIAGPA